MVAGLLHPHWEFVPHFAPFPPLVALYMLYIISQSMPEYLIQDPREYFLFKRVCYTLLFRALQFHGFVPRGRIWFSKYPRSQGFFPLFKKPWEREYPNPTSSPGRFSATSKPRGKRPGDEVGIGYSFLNLNLNIVMSAKSFGTLRQL